MSEPTTTAPITSEPERRGPQTVLDMVRSMVVVMAGVVALVLLVPRPAEPIRQPVDVEGAATRAAAADAPAVVPDLPAGWSPNSARFTAGGEDGVPTWHVGYLTPTERYAGLAVAEGATPRWLSATTSRGDEVGTQEVAGRDWTELLSGDGTRRSLVLESGGVTTVVTGTALLDELAVLAEAATE